MPHDDLHETIVMKLGVIPKNWKNFDQEAVSQSLDFQTDDEDEELVPEFKPKRRRGFMRVIFSILQMVAVFILFLSSCMALNCLSTPTTSFGMQSGAMGNQNTETPALLDF